MSRHEVDWSIENADGLCCHFRVVALVFLEDELSVHRE